ncbi:MAG: response regulator transcription factor [Steroidobacteraceae bacterium]
MNDRIPTVFIVDDDDVTRRYFSAILTAEQLQCRTVESAQAFLDAYDPLQPGCLLLDVQMPGMTGLQLQQQLNLRGAVIPVIFISGHAEVPTAVEALLQGAFGFLQKPVAAATLLAHVRKALDHDAGNRAELRERERIIKRFRSLTRREHDVLMLLMAGRSNKVMASDLSLSQRTVELYRARVMEKTGARSLAQLIRMAMELDVVPDDRSRTIGR